MRKYLSLLFLLLATFVACEEQPEVDVKQPELALLSSETLLFDAQGGNGEIVYSLKNGVEGKSVEASCDTEWVTDIVVADKITFRVAANDKEELRTATITVSYDKLSFLVNLRQAAAEPIPDSVVELVADKERIESDGEECVTFTVYVDEQEVTTGYTITNLTAGEALEGNRFVSTEAGDYKFQAVYGEYSSNEVIITVFDPEVSVVPIITADKMEIKADGEDTVTFTVTYEGEDVTAESKIRCLTTGNTLEANTFTTTEAGDYTFNATCDATVEASVQITIVATATEPEPDPVPTITLEADKNVIVADGKDKAVFTVKADDKPLSDGFEIINLADNKPLTAAEFTTTTAGDYSFKAKVGDYESKVVNILATAAEDPQPEPEPTFELHSSAVSVAPEGGVGEILYELLAEDGVELTAKAVDSEWITSVAVAADRVTFTVPANDTGVRRIGTVILACGDYSQSVSVAQDPLPVKEASLTLISEERMMFGADGGSGTISYKLENPVEGVSIEAACDAAWVKNINTTMVNGKVLFNVDANTETSSRNTRLTVSYGELSFSVAIEQEAGQAEQPGDDVTPGRDPNKDYELEYKATHLNGEVNGDEYTVILSQVGIDKDVTNPFNMPDNTTCFVISICASKSNSATIPEGVYTYDGSDYGGNKGTFYGMGSYYYDWVTMGSSENVRLAFEGGTVTVTAEGIYVDGEFSVSDNGSDRKVYYYAEYEGPLTLSYNK